MAEPSRSGGCFPSILLIMAAIIIPLIAAFHSVTSPLTLPTATALVTTVVLEPIGQFTSADLHQAATVIQKRLKSLLISGAKVEEAEDSIRLDLPQVDDLNLILRVVTARGLLEFVDFSGITELPAWTGKEILTTGQGDHPISDYAANNPVTNKPFATVMSTSDVRSAAATLQDDQ